MKIEKLGFTLRDFFLCMGIPINYNWHKKAVLYLRGGDGGEHGPILYNLVKTRKAKRILDIGTARGFSALYMAKALVDHQYEDARARLFIQSI